MTYARYVENIFDDYLRRLVNGNGSRKPRIGEYYPYMLGMCPRKGYYTYVHGPRLTDQSIRYVTIGVHLHNFILKGYADRGYKVEVPFEYVVRDGVRIRGRVDGVSVDHILELKTSAYLPKEPQDYHLAQVSLYMKGMDRDKAYLLYVSRNDFSSRAFEVSFDRKAYNRAVGTALSIHEGLLSGTPPDPSPVAEWECESCPYKELCQGEEE